MVSEEQLNRTESSVTMFQSMPPESSTSGDILEITESIMHARPSNSLLTTKNEASPNSISDSDSLMWESDDEDTNLTKSLVVIKPDSKKDD